MRRVGIGVRILPDHQAANFGIEGVVVIEPVPGGPAARAGLRAMEIDRRGRVYSMDVIVGIDDIRITVFDDLYRALDSKKPGERVTLHIQRDGRTGKVEVVLQELE